MSYSRDLIRQRFSDAFDDRQAEVLTDVVHNSYQDLVKTNDFNELKAIIKDIVEIQKSNEILIVELSQITKENQKEIKELTLAIKDTRGDLGGLSRTMGYALENEAYRMVPNLLRERYGIEMKEKLIRKEILKHEINLLGRANRNGKEILVVGEAKLRLDERRYLQKKNIFEELEDKVKLVQSVYGELEVVRILITHFAGNAILKKAEEIGVIVIQSFDW